MSMTTPTTSGRPIGVPVQRRPDMTIAIPFELVTQLRREAAKRDLPLARLVREVLDGVIERRLFPKALD